MAEESGANAVSREVVVILMEIISRFHHARRLSKRIFGSVKLDARFLRRSVYGLSSQGPACHPKNIQEVVRQLNLSQILK